MNTLKALTVTLILFVYQTQGQMIYVNPSPLIIDTNKLKSKEVWKEEWKEQYKKQLPIAIKQQNDYNKYINSIDYKIMLANQEKERKAQEKLAKEQLAEKQRKWKEYVDYNTPKVTHQMKFFNSGNLHQDVEYRDMRLHYINGKLDSVAK